MSIASAITAAQGKVAAAYTAISNKGGTLPATQNLSNMPTAINSIPSGSSPTIQSLSVTPSTSAQTFNASGVDGYKPVSVSAVTSSIDANITAGNIKKNVTILGVTGTYEGSGGGGYTEFPSYQVTNGVATRRSGALTGTEFSNITEIGSSAMSYAFYYHSGLTGALDLSSLTTIGNNGIENAFNNCVGLTSVDLSALTSVNIYGMSNAFRNCTGLTGALDLSALTSVDSYGMNYAFNSCNGLTSLDLSALTSIGGNGMYYAFAHCGLLTSVDLSSLTTISGSNAMQYAFYYCSRITSVDLSSLTSISSNGMSSAFYACSGLTSVNLPALTSISSNGMSSTFNSCTGLEHVYFRALTTTSFGSYTNQFAGMLSSTGSTKTHTLHFPSNLETTIQGLTGYPRFGGTSGYVVLAFDLPATS